MFVIDANFQIALLSWIMLIEIIYIFCIMIFLIYCYKSYVIKLCSRSFEVELSWIFGSFVEFNGN